MTGTARRPHRPHPREARAGPRPGSFLRLDRAPERYAQSKPPGSVSWDCRGPRACGVRSVPSDGGRGPADLPSLRAHPARPDAPRRLLVVVSARASTAPRRRFPAGEHGGRGGERVGVAERSGIGRPTCGAGQSGSASPGSCGRTPAPSGAPRKAAPYLPWIGAGHNRGRSDRDPPGAEHRARPSAGKERDECPRHGPGLSGRQSRSPAINPLQFWDRDPSPKRLRTALLSPTLRDRFSAAPKLPLSLV